MKKEYYENILKQAITDMTDKGEVAENKVCANCDYSRKIEEDDPKIFCIKNNCVKYHPMENRCYKYATKHTEPEEPEIHVNRRCIGCKHYHCTKYGDHLCNYHTREIKHMTDAVDCKEYVAFVPFEDRVPVETVEDNTVDNHFPSFCERYMKNLHCKHFKILGHEWTIEVVKFNNNEYLKKHDAEGVAKPHLRKIIISDGTDKTFLNDDERLSRFKHCLRHEVIHAFLEESGLAACSTKTMKPWARNEEMVDWFAKMSTDIYKVYGALGLFDELRLGGNSNG